MAADREARWLDARAEREAALNRHPFRRDASLHFEEVVIRDPSGDQPIVLVVFTDALDKVGIPVSEFFESVEGSYERLVIRRMGLPFFAHAIGSDLRSAVAWFTRLLDGRPTLFVGNSMGAFPALLLGTLCEVDAVFVANPTTSLLPRHLDMWEDNRYGYLAELGRIPEEHRDIATLWQSQPGVPTHMHFSYRDPLYRGHAEHIAEFENVRSSAYFQYQPMYELTRTHRLGGLIDGLLSEIAMRHLRASTADGDVAHGG